MLDPCFLLLTEAGQSDTISRHRERQTSLRRKSVQQREHPRGTLVIVLIFLALTVVVWAGVYAALLGRG